MMNSDVECLTPRQRQCLELVGAGLVAKEIARELRLSPDTVAAHIKTGMSKLGVSSRREAGRIVAAHLATNPDRVSPFGVITDEPEAEDQASPVNDQAASDRLHEIQPQLDLGSRQGVFRPGGIGAAPEGAWPPMLLTIVMAIAIGVIVLMAYPLSESFQRLANLVDPPTP